MFDSRERGSHGATASRERAPLSHGSPKAWSESLRGEWSDVGSVKDRCHQQLAERERCGHAAAAEPSKPVKPLNARVGTHHELPIGCEGAKAGPSAPNARLRQRRTPRLEALRKSPDHVVRRR